MNQLTLRVKNRSTWLLNYCVTISSVTLCFTGSMRAAEDEVLIKPNIVII